MRRKLEEIKLYLITDDKRSRGRDVEHVVSAAVRGGVRCVQYRPWQTTDALFLQTALRLRDITSKAGALLIINDRIDIASLCLADGVHLGAGDIPIDQARRLIGDTGYIGYSVHSTEEASAIVRAGADYITFSPIFPTTSASRPRPALGVETVMSLEISVSIPVFALGGINMDNVSQLTGSGIDRIAVVSAITQADDIEAAARQLCEAVGQE